MISSVRPSARYASPESGERLSKYSTATRPGPRPRASFAAKAAPSPDSQTTAARPATSAAAPIPSQRRGGQPVPAGAAPSAAAKAPAVGNRSARSLARARETARSTPGGTARTVDNRGIGALRHLAMIACAVGPVYGGSPASSSYVTQPKA